MGPEDVLAFWFGDDPALWRDDPWFAATPTFDAVCRERFADLLAQAGAGALDPWAGTPGGALALVIVLDQFSRNVHRGTPLAFATDARARDIARAAIAAGFEAALTPVQRVFLYLPFGHSEDLVDQDLAVRLIGTLHGTAAERNIPFAVRHRDVVRRFGRFPHRNAVLGRADTADEVAWLAEHGSAPYAVSQRRRRTV